jgi:Protein of unknown function (DUF433)
MSTATSWINKTPDVQGGEACVRNTRHTVWGVWSGGGLACLTPGSWSTIPI